MFTVTGFENRDPYRATAALTSASYPAALGELVTEESNVGMIVSPVAQAGAPSASKMPQDTTITLAIRIPGAFLLDRLYARPRPLSIIGLTDTYGNIT